MFVFKIAWVFLHIPYQKTQSTKYGCKPIATLRLPNYCTVGGGVL